MPEVDTELLNSESISHHFDFIRAILRGRNRIATKRRTCCVSATFPESVFRRDDNVFGRLDGVLCGTLPMTALQIFLMGWVTSILAGGHDLPVVPER